MRRSTLERFLPEASSLASHRTGVSRRSPTARACSATRAHFCTPVFSTCADQHLSERITLLYNLVRTSFDFVDGSPRHARHKGSDSR